MNGFMKNDHQKIEAYLRGEMTGTEKQEFEDEIRQNKALQAAALAGLFETERVPETAKEMETRNLIAQIRSETGPLSPPQISILDHIRFFFYAFRLAIIGSGLFLLLTATLAFIFWPVPCHELLDTAFIKPYCGDQAGSANVPNHNLKNRASYIFCGVTPGGTDSLLALSGKTDSFNIANFYLAHGYFMKNDHNVKNDYNKAVSEFEKCQSNIPYLKRYDRNGYEEAIVFNLLLSKMGKAQSCSAFIPDLDRFIARYPANENAKGLREALRNPLRILTGD